MKSYVFTTDNEIKEVAPKGDKWTLKELQNIVGGYIECYTLNEYVVVLNEEGKLKNLPFNKLITELLWHTLCDELVGDVLITTVELMGD